MNVLGKLFHGHDDHSSELILVAPVNGKVVDITQVPDPIFSEKLLGDGVAIEPEDGTIVSPMAGVVTAFPDSLHAFTVKNNRHIEILVHVGLETVGMEGDGFEAQTSVNAEINAGDPALHADLESVRKAGNHTITPVVVTSMEKLSSMEILVTAGQTVQAGDPILKLTLS